MAQADVAVAKSLINERLLKGEIGEAIRESIQSGVICIGAASGLMFHRGLDRKVWIMSRFNSTKVASLAG